MKKMSLSLICGWASMDNAIIILFWSAINHVRTACVVNTVGFCTHGSANIHCTMTNRVNIPKMIF